MLPPHFCLWQRKGGPIRHNKGIRYIPDKEQKCLTEDQARHIYKKVEMDKIINRDHETRDKRWQNDKK